MKRQLFVLGFATMSALGSFALAQPSQAQLALNDTEPNDQVPANVTQIQRNQTVSGSGTLTQPDQQDRFHFVPQAGVQELELRLSVGQRQVTMHGIEDGNNTGRSDRGDRSVFTGGVLNNSTLNRVVRVTAGKPYLFILTGDNANYQLSLTGR